jgi:hypothetical protein
MIFTPRTLCLGLAALLLGAALIGCGNSGDSTSSKKKPQEKTTFRSTRALDQDLQGDKPYLSLRAMEVSREGQKKSLQQPKSADILKDPGTLLQPKSADVLKEYRTPAESPGGKRRRKIVSQPLPKGPNDKQ